MVGNIRINTINKMKRHILIASLAILSAFVTTSCEDKRADNLTPTKVYFPNSDVNNAILYNVGEPVVYKLGVYKSGAMTTAAQVETVILTESELKTLNTENNTNYQLIPASCYAVENLKLNFSPEDRTCYIDILFNPSDLISLAEFEDGNYILPIQIVSASVDINESKKISLLKPLVKEPLVYLKSTGFSPNVIDDDGAESVEVEVPIAIDFENKWDIICDFIVNPALIDVYNKENGTAFELLPEDSYIINNQTTINKETKASFIKVKVERSKLTYGDYILPLELSSVSKFSVDEKLAQSLIGVSYQAKTINKPTWTIAEFSSEEPGEGAPNGLATAILDGDPATFWHSKWTEAVELPHFITIDMIEEFTVVQVDLTRRVNNSDTKSGEIHISSDNVAWEKIASYEMKKTNDSQAFPCKKTKGRYLKVIFKESNRAPHCNLAELVVRGI